MKPVRSVEETMRDSNYEPVAYYQGDKFSFSQPWVVRHRATGTLWASVFEEGQWFEVEAQTSKRTHYARVTGDCSPPMSRRSPEKVAKDKGFDHVAHLDWHRNEPHVVREKSTNKLYGCVYAVRDDDSDYDVSTNWFEVTAEEVVQTKYEHKKSSAA